LSREKETGLIIADIIDYGDTVEGDRPRQRKLLDELLYERMRWRINPKSDIEPLIASKYKFESQSCFLLDDIHYVHSKHSIFIQIFDVVIYAVMRVFTYLNQGIIKADITKVPITVDTFRLFLLDNTSFACFDSTKKDVSYTVGKELLFQADDSEFASLKMFEYMYK
jgi:hypothetical protein